MSSQPFISVIVPVFNGAHFLPICLQALVASDYANFEIIVVDDCSSDASVEAATIKGFQVLQLPTRSGAAAARNAGARAAHGDIFLFVDADVQVRADTIARVAGKLSERSDLSALFGSYDDRPYDESFVSQYKNLYHHFIHQHGDSEAFTFWTGCGAVQREVFEAVGGFNPALHSIEDIEFGYRLRDQGFAILLDKSLQVKHLKTWTVASLVRSDIFDRAIPWSRLILETGRMNNDLNLRQNHKLSSVLTGFLVALFPLAFFLPLVGHIELFLVLTLLMLNYDLYAFFLKKRGLPFTFLAIILHFFYYFYSGVTFVMCWAAFSLKRNLGWRKANC